MSITHTPECIRIQARIEEEEAAYEQAWPNYCRACGGWGGRNESFDPSPAGVGLSPGSMSEFVPCISCLEKLICPRCGAEGMPDEDEAPCPACKWNGDPGLSQGYECECWEKTICQPVDQDDPISRAFD